MKFKRFLSVFFILLVGSVFVFSDIYVYISKDGQKIISNFSPYEYKKILKIIKTKKHFFRSNLKSKKYEEKIYRISSKYGVDPNLVKAIIKVESNFNSVAISNKGAKGLMQLMEETARDYGVYSDEVFDPEKNLTAGIRHLKRLINKYGINNLQKVLAAYNAGETAVDTYGGIPPYRETIRYVKKVIKEYKGIIPKLNISYSKKKTKRRSKINIYYDKDGVLCISNIHRRDRN